MAINENLTKWLMESPAFMAKYKSLLIHSASNQIGGDFEADQNLDKIEIDWKYLLHCASIFSSSNLASAHDQALRISQFALTSNINTSLKYAAAIVLKNLSNQLAIDLAIERGLIKNNFHDELPTLNLLDWKRFSLKNEIITFNDEEVHASDFQLELWNKLPDSDLISVSAPTSAGKSFILKKWITDYICTNNRSTIVFIVPTRALITEVERDLRDLLSGHGDSINITSSPLPTAISQEKSNVLVFTQERLQILINQSTGTLSKIDILIIDEAHKLGDKYRGVLLQQVLEKIFELSPKSKIVFLSPLTKNPEDLLIDFKDGKKTTVIRTQENTVNQNLIWCEQKRGNKKKWLMSLCTMNGKHNLGVLKLANSPTPSSKRLSYIAYTIGNRTSGNVIYVNSAADAEKFAIQIYEFTGENETELLNNKELKELISLSKTQIHKKYLLSKTLSRGIAFHYGNMPDIIRSEIERLFSKGIIKFLICTSTLIEGVNTSCKNIFLRNPKKGAGNPMNSDDFWNLAGRAGRWGKEFQGNIFCIDPCDWDGNEAPKFRTEFNIERSTDNALLSLDKLLSYIKGEDSKIDRTLEYVFSYLYSQYHFYGSLHETPWSKRFSEESLGILNEALASVSDNITVPVDVINQNPGISPLVINNLYLKLEDDVLSGERNFEDLVPLSPDEKSAVAYYQRLFILLQDYLKSANLAVNEKHALGNSLTVLAWMKGTPLSQLISNRIKYEANRGNDNYQKIIRNVMGQVETVARFEAPKYLSCYNDILKHLLQKNNRDDLCEDLTSFDLLLEYGLPLQTQISFVSIGLSRVTAIQLSELIESDSFTEDDCLRWLRIQDLESLQVSPIIIREVNNILKFLG